jgi:Na+-driven multidrug efflux pump
VADSAVPREHRGPRRPLDRQILALAVPALGALVAEPLFVLVDSAVVGHLGTEHLAGLSVASTILLTLVGLCVFLAYATTASVARRVGAGRRAEALQSGVDGMWLAAGLGVVLATALWLLAPWSISAMGAEGAGRAPACQGCSWCSPRQACCAACRTPAPRCTWQSAGP